MIRTWLTLLLLTLTLILKAQDSVSFVIIAHSFDNKEKAYAIADEYIEKNIKCEVIEANNSGIYRICLNRYPDYTSANISRKALMKSKTIPTDAWILTETISKELSPDNKQTYNKPKKETKSNKRYIIYNGKVFKVPVLKKRKE